MSVSAFHVTPKVFCVGKSFPSAISTPDTRSSIGTSVMTDDSFESHFRNLKPASDKTSERSRRNDQASSIVSNESRTSSTYMELSIVSATFDFSSLRVCPCDCKTY